MLLVVVATKEGSLVQKKLHNPSPGTKMGVMLSRLCGASAPMGPANAEENLRVTYLLFYFRVRAIQILYEEKIGSTSNGNWDEISTNVSRCDEEISDETLENLTKFEASKAAASHLEEFNRKLEAITAAATHRKSEAITAAASHLNRRWAAITAAASHLNRRWAAITAAASHLEELNRKLEAITEELNRELEANTAAASDLGELNRKLKAITEDLNRELEANTAAASHLGELNREVEADTAAASQLAELNRKLEKITATVILQKIEKVSDVFDHELLPCLRGEVDLMKKLEDCLPRDGDISEEFVSRMKIDPRDFLKNVQSSAGLEALRTFKLLTSKFQSNDPKKSGEVSKRTKETINVFYATNRKISDGDYTTKRGKELSYGVCPVSIPPVHQRGKVESGNESDHANGLKHFSVAKSPPLEESEFLKQIKGACEQVCVQLITPSQNTHSTNDVASSSGGPQKVYGLGLFRCFAQD